MLRHMLGKKPAAMAGFGQLEVWWTKASRPGPTFHPMYSP